jgi:hypothetical protein
MNSRYLVALLLAVGVVGCGQSSSPVMPVVSCGFALTPDTQAAPVAGGTFTVTMSTAASTGTCSWTATADEPWITIASGSTGAVTTGILYSVSSNGGAIRRGTITGHNTSGEAVATLTVVQAGSE